MTKQVYILFYTTIIILLLALNCVVVCRDSSLNSQDRKLILFWTTFYGHEYFEFGEGHQSFKDNKCEINNCETTCDRSRLPSADVVVFHMRNVQGTRDLPLTRRPHQIFVFYLLEHPENQWNDLRQFNGYFNATMTYRMNSTIPIAYGESYPINENDATSNEKQAKSIHEDDIQYAQSHREPPTRIAWFVSNCNSPGGRHLFYDQLKKYIDIDVYGNCGTLKCPENTAFHIARMDEECYHSLSSKGYKFYLSFESHSCFEYVTEKFWNILRLSNRVIPIVLGSANYTKIAPAHSYIDAADYTPKQLAALLISLDSNEREFNEYFRWRKTVGIRGQVEMSQRGFCRLCALINTDGSDPKPNFSPIVDLHRWWTKGGTACNRNRMPKLATRK